jgi:hypothetical protein
MDQNSFFAAVLPQQGFRYVACFFPDSRLPNHRDFAQGDEANMVGYAGWADKKLAEVYFAVGGYLPGPDGTMARKAVNAQWHRSLRLDLDVGPEPGKYPSQRDAVVAVDGFMKAFNLPKPWLVDSGYGIHVYWPLERDVSLIEWLTLSEQLKAATLQHQLLVDHTTTTDAARILRFPGMTNRKHGTTKPVRLLCEGVPTPPEHFAAVLPQGGMAITPTYHAPIAARQVSELQQNLHPPYWLRGVLLGCPGMQAMMANGGANAQEPLWKATLDLVHGAVDDMPKREAVARHLSAGHPGFTASGFAYKWDQTKAQNYQPPTCERMAQLGMPECRACPLRASVRSPVVLGRAVAATPSAPAIGVPLSPAPTPPPPPQAVVVGVFAFVPGSSKVTVIDGPLTKELWITNGLPCLRRTKPAAIEGNPPTHWDDPIIRYRIVEVERLLDARGVQALTAITFDCHTDGLRRIEFSHNDLSEPRAFNALLQANGIHINRRSMGVFQDTFMAEFLSQLQRTKPASKIASHCGWVDDFSGFVLGTTMYHAGSIEHVRPSPGSTGEMEAYHAKGDEAQWRQAFDIALSGGADRQVVLALAIASPLMAFTGVEGLLLNAYSPESGVGKSTLCNAALSIWGSPNKLRKDFRDTPNATFKLASIVGNLPMVVDEFTNVEGRQLSDYVYTLTQGREKHRLSSDAKLNTSGDRWCLPTITTSNNSVLEKLQLFRADAVAEAARVFELRLSPLSMDSEELRHNKLHLQALSENYGFLGPKLLDVFLARSGDEWRTVLSQRIAYWDTTLNTTAADRFRSACAALVEMGAAIGKAMGYAFDPAAVRAELAAQWASAQTEFEANKKTPADLIHAYYMANMSEFVLLGGERGDALLQQMPRKDRGEIRGRSGNGKYQPDTVMIPTAYLKLWCRDENVSYKSLQEWLRAQLKDPSGAVTRMGRLTYLQGLNFSTTTEAVELRAAAVMGTTTLTVAAATTIGNQRHA